MTEWTDDGRPAAWVTEVEPEFDANERDGWYARKELLEATCPKCGNLRAICSNPDGLDGGGYYPQVHVCYVSAARDMVSRRWHERHQKSRPDDHGYLPTDGRTVWAALADLEPDSTELDFLAEEQAEPTDDPEED